MNLTRIALALENVDKIYQRRGKPPVHAVKALNMEIESGEIVALLGSSGPMNFCFFSEI